MNELLPGRQATRLRAGLIDYLTTTFAFVDFDAQAALRELLEDEAEGMFKGPYLLSVCRSAPRPAEPSHRWTGCPPASTPTPTRQQRFRRLPSLNGRPQATLVTPGTGSGKTEAFLYPILDHCLRARRQGLQPSGT